MTTDDGHDNHDDQDDVAVVLVMVRVNNDNDDVHTVTHRGNKDHDTFLNVDPVPKTPAALPEVRAGQPAAHPIPT